MRKIYFIFGYQVSSWSEYGRSVSFEIKGVMEINPEDPVDMVISSILEKLKENITSKKLEKNISFGGSGDLGGSSTTFYSNFFCEEGNIDFIKKISGILQDKLGEIFDLEHKNI